MGSGDEIITNSYDPAVSAELATFMATGWDAPVTCAPDVAALPFTAFTAARRSALADAFAGTTIAVCAGTAPWRNGDQHHLHRSSSEFLFLVGAHRGADELEDAVLVLHSGTATLFAPAPTVAGTAEHWRDRTAGGLWVGHRPALADLAARLQLEVAPLSELEGCLAGITGEIALVGGTAPALLTAIDRGPVSADVVQYLDTARLTKDPYEIGELRRAVAATELAFEDLARELTPGVRERWLEGSFSRRARSEGDAMGYHPIVAAGSHACVLHWMRNDGIVGVDDLLLVDAGVELESGYTADVTRVLPASGRFSPVQGRVYDAVREAQAAGVAAVVPGAGFYDPHMAAMQVVCEHLADWGVLQVTPAEALERGVHRRWTLHGSSHMLGLDVHDCSEARDELYSGGSLAENYVLTVEPGVYFQPDDLTVPDELRGIGVRIEDDVLVTSIGHENLSEALPRDILAVEQWMAAL